MRRCYESARRFIVLEYGTNGANVNILCVVISISYVYPELYLLYILRHIFSRLSDASAHRRHEQLCREVAAPSFICAASNSY